MQPDLSPLPHRVARADDHIAATRATGQSLVEFALILPIVSIMLLAIVDMSRVFTAVMAVESAAREAADYGAWRSGNWRGDPADSLSNRYKTVVGMESRACAATSNLVNFDGDSVTCTNPSIRIDVLDENGDSAIDPADGTLLTNCDESPRMQDTNELAPCRVEVELTYDFDLIMPVGIDLFDTRLGLPQTLTFSRSSVFAISDFELDT